jgi:hypothetical protein
MYTKFIHYHINPFDILPFLSWRKDRSRPASSSMLLCRIDMPIVKMNCEMIACGRRRQAGPSHITKSESVQLEVRPRRPRVCTLSQNITQFERRKGRSAGPVAAGAAARPVPVTSPSPSQFKSGWSPGPSRAALRLTISGRPSSVTVRVTVGGPLAR